MTRGPHTAKVSYECDPTQNCKCAEMRSFFFFFGDLKNKQKPVNCIDYKIANLSVEMVGHICFVVLTS